VARNREKYRCTRHTGAGLRRQERWWWILAS